MGTSFKMPLIFEVHFAGTFDFLPLRYENGAVMYWRVERDKKMDYQTVIKYLGERTDEPLHQLFFCLPQCELDKGLKVIENDTDFFSMYDYAQSYGLIHVYIAHGPQDLYPYYVENLYIPASDEEVQSMQTSPKHAGNMSFEELIAWAEETASMDVSVSVGNGVSGNVSVEKDTGSLEKAKGTVDKGKSIMVDEGRIGQSRKCFPRKRNVGIVIHDNVNPCENELDDSDSDIDLQEMFGDVHEEDYDSEYSDKSIDYLSEGKEELISLRKRKSEAKHNPTPTKPSRNKQEDGGSRPNRVYDEAESDIVRDHQEYMDNLMFQLRNGDDGETDPFTILENSDDKFPFHDTQTHWKLRKPKVGEKYVNADQFKECITFYGLANGYSLWFYRSSTEQVIARCGFRPETLKDEEKGKQRKWNKYPSAGRDEHGKCPFRCYGKKMLTENSFQVISMTDKHTCVRSFKFGSLVNYKWIRKQFGNKIRQTLDIKLHEIADIVLKKYKCTISPGQCRNAKKYALNEGQATTEEHYAMIRSYGKAILDSNEGSTVKLGVTVNPDDKTYFNRFYCCFSALKKGFVVGCRPIIALDGCFLKKPNVGEILTAIGRDGNNHIFPIAWAIVKVENKDNWTWFLELLGEDVGMPNGDGLTLISDQHKGLIEAVKDVMPFAEHRQCARHIYEGFRKQYNGVEFRSLFWAAAKASYPELFNKIMLRIKKANPGAHEYLVKKDPKTWSRAFFRLGTNCEAVENGFSECFNSVLLNVRNKPLITMLESMRVIVMERLNTMRNIIDKWDGPICANIQKRLELNKDEHRFWHVIPAGGDTFEVRNGCDAFRVDENVGTCSRRMWQLSGVPCCHAIAVMFKLNKRPEDYLPPCFRVLTNNEIYHQYMNPLGGMTFWPDSSQYFKVLPPKPKKMPGRPRKKRIRAPHERKNPSRVSKAGAEMTCTNCLQKGHNRRACSNATVLIPPKQPPQKGRPKKNKKQIPESVGVGSSRSTVNVNEAPRVPSRIASEGARNELPLRDPSSVGVKRSLFGCLSNAGTSTSGTLEKRMKKGLTYTVASMKVQSQTFSDPIEGSQDPATQHNVGPPTQKSQTNSGRVAQAGQVRARSNFVRPRPPSQRILKNKLAKSIPGIGSSKANSIDVD